MSDRTHCHLTAFFFWLCTIVCWSLASCTVMLTMTNEIPTMTYEMRTMTYKINHELTNQTIVGDIALTLHDVKRPVTCALLCPKTFLCGFFFHNAATGVCVLPRSPYISFNVTHAPGYTMFTMAKFPTVTLDSETGLCPGDPVTPMGCWKQVPGSLTQVSVGAGGVWGLNEKKQISHKLGTYEDPSASGQEWHVVNGELVQVDVGSDAVCGTIKNRIYCRLNITSSLPYGSGSGGTSGRGWGVFSPYCRWVTLSPAGSVWRVNTDGELLHARGSASQLTNATEWDVVATDMRRVDAGRAGVWALDEAGRLHHRRGTYGDDGGTSAGTGWVVLGGEFSFVSSGTGSVVAVTGAGRVWVRVGLSADTPTGWGWALYPGIMKQVEVYEDGPVAGLWAVDFSDNVYFSVIQK